MCKMKVYRSAVGVALAVSNTSPGVLAFATTKTLSAGASGRRSCFSSVGIQSKNVSPTNIVPSETMRSRRGGGLNMIFRDFFKSAGLGLGAGGGAFGLQIDYATLDHPGPELGKLAMEGIVPVTSKEDPTISVATFAGGCFWGLELAFQRIPGIIETAVGYTQGPEKQPNYDQVCAGATGHTEAVIVYFDAAEVSYEELLNIFFQRINPTVINGQGRDYGKQYRTGVYFHTTEQEEIARRRFESENNKYKNPIATELKPAKIFWPAEKHHQQYLEKGGRFGTPQSAEKGATDEIRCYG